MVWGGGVVVAAALTWCMPACCCPDLGEVLGEGKLFG